MMFILPWPLIAFTILAQLSVGMFVVLGVVHFFAIRNYSSEEAERLSDYALLAIGPALVLGLLASLAHLGHPILAFLAVTNLKTSWLSWEILLGVLFAILGGVFALMQWRKIAPFTVRNVIAWLAAIDGLALVYVMSRIYRQPTIPSWNTVLTTLSFYTTALLLGSLGVGAAFVGSYAYLKRKNPDCEDNVCELLQRTIRGISVTAILLLGVEFVITPLYIAYLAYSSVTSVAAVVITQTYDVIFIVRLVLVFLGAGLLGVFLYRNTLSTERVRVMTYLTYSAFILVLIAEVLGRFMFYASYINIGV
jgi:anaerobic dimethyl sulfoxide reductase subunit C (anchor subunit)